MKSFPDIGAIRGMLRAVGVQRSYHAGYQRKIQVYDAECLYESSKPHIVVLRDAEESSSAVYVLAELPTSHEAYEFAKKRALLMTKAARRHKRWLTKKAAKRRAAYTQRQKENPAWGMF